MENLIVILCIQALFAIGIGRVAELFRRDFWNWFVIAMLFGPVLSGIAVLIMGKPKDA